MSHEEEAVDGFDGYLEVGPKVEGTEAKKSYSIFSPSTWGRTAAWYEQPGDKSRNFLRMSSINGLNRMPDGAPFYRIIWTLLVLGGIGCSLFLIVGLVDQYRDYETTTSVSLAQPSEDGLEMPMVTFCDANPFSPTKLLAIRPDYFSLDTQQKLKYRNITDINQIKAREWNEVKEKMKKRPPKKSEVLVLASDENFIVNAILANQRSFMQPTNQACCEAWMNNWMPMEGYTKTFEPNWAEIQKLNDQGKGCVPVRESMPDPPGYPHPDGDADCATIEGCEAFLTESLKGSCNGNEFCDNSDCYDAATRLQLWLDVTDKTITNGTDSSISQRLTWISNAIEKCDQGEPVGKSSLKSSVVAHRCLA